MNKFMVNPIICFLLLTAFGDQDNFQAHNDFYYCPFPWVEPDRPEPECAAGFSGACLYPFRGIP